MPFLDPAWHQLRRVPAYHFPTSIAFAKPTLQCSNNLPNWSPAGGVAGELTDSRWMRAAFAELLKTNTYRGGLPRAMSMQDIWPLCLLIGALALFGDIFVRRVSIDYAYPFKWLLRRLRPGETAQDSERKQSLEQLAQYQNRSLGELAQGQSATRFEVHEGSAVGVPDHMLDDAQAGAASAGAGASRNSSATNRVWLSGGARRLYCSIAGGQKSGSKQEQTSLPRGNCRSPSQRSVSTAKFELKFGSGSAQCCSPSR